MERKRTHTSPFVKLDEPVSFASSSKRVIQTNQAGRVIGFGCSGAEEEALENLEGFLRQARAQPDSISQEDFEREVHERVQALEQEVLRSHIERSQQNPEAAEESEDESYAESDDEAGESE